MNLLEYFDVDLLWKEEIPKISFKLKTKFREGKKPLFKKGGQPISGAQVEYYINYLGEEVGGKVYEERRKYFGVKNFFLFLKKYKIVNKESEEKYALYLETINEKVKKNHKVAINKLEYREKLKKAYNHNLHSQIHKDLWKDKDYRKKIINSYDSIKRSNNLKKRWSEKESQIIFLNSHNNKNYICNGIKMNSIEFLIAQVLNELEIKWVYEKSFFKNNKSYFPDFYLFDYNIVIECYGDYWHANPEIYNENDKKWKRKKSASDIWKADEDRKKFYEELGIDFCFFWEHEINKNLNEI